MPARQNQPELPVATSVLLFSVYKNGQLEEGKDHPQMFFLEKAVNVSCSATESPVLSAPAEGTLLKCPHDEVSCVCARGSVLLFSHLKS